METEDGKTFPDLHFYTYLRYAADRVGGPGVQGGTIPIKIGPDAQLDPYGHANEAYQADLGKLRDRESNLIDEFAANLGTMSDDAAKNLLDDSLSIDSGYLTLRRSYLAKFREVLPDTKVARYYQLENKIEAVLEYEQAKRIPLIR